MAGAAARSAAPRRSRSPPLRGGTVPDPRLRRRSSSLPVLPPPRAARVSGSDGVQVSVPSAVLSYSLQDLIVYYTVEICAPGRSWRVCKRYSDFEDLQRELLGREAGGKLGLALRQAFASIPSLPTRSMFSATNQSRRAIERRRGELQQYLRSLVTHTRSAPARFLVDAFLRPCDNGVDAVESRMYLGQVQQEPEAPQTGVSGFLHSWNLPPIVTTRWLLSPSADSDSDTAPAEPPRLLVNLPWAREDHDADRGHCCHIKSQRGELRDVVHKRFREFSSFCQWMHSSGDKVPTVREALWWVARYRKRAFTSGAAPLWCSQAGFSRFSQCRIPCRFPPAQRTAFVSPTAFRAPSGEQMELVVSPPPPGSPQAVPSRLTSATQQSAPLPLPPSSEATPPAGVRFAQYVRSRDGIASAQHAAETLPAEQQHPHHEQAAGAALSPTATTLTDAAPADSEDSEDSSGSATLPRSPGGLSDLSAASESVTALRRTAAAPDCGRCLRSLPIPIAAPRAYG
eukprot:TRINITY_DN4316_c0_g1_i2.p1 TRINITY_DN4316_c0_g1~~TRINITY_DN4316_c0_g1_i2.p1  ORF type:complete len:513 (+),score=99.99 TRINITY_DN4316_c0_g1_i2:115-1653(+)